MPSTRFFYLRVSLLVYTVWMLLHIMVGTIARRFPAHDFSLAIDQGIPLIPWFVWIYLFAYLFPFFLLLAAKDWHWINIAILSLTLENIFAYPVFLNFPVTFAQPVLGDSFSEHVLQLVYSTHLPPGANNFPSLHVALALTFYFCFRKQITSPAGSSFVGVTALLIALSTLFVKEHIFADVLAGIFWAIGGWALARFLYPRIVDISQEPEVALRVMIRRLLPFILATFVLTGLGTTLHRAF